MDADNMIVPVVSFRLGQEQIKPALDRHGSQINIKSAPLVVPLVVDS